jgi:hypothetical protein
MGFVGGHSEITWLYRLKRYLDVGKIMPVDSPGYSCYQSSSSVSFFLDDSEIRLLPNVDLLARPSQEVADQLVDRYFRTLHTCFPLIRKELFMAQYRSFYTDCNVQPGKRWLAVLNMIFALGAHDFLLTECLAPRGESSAVFLSRAWKLGIVDYSSLRTPSLQQVQVEGLACLYLLCIGHINRYAFFGSPSPNHLCASINTCV